MLLLLVQVCHRLERSNARCSAWCTHCRLKGAHRRRSSHRFDIDGFSFGLGSLLFVVFRAQVDKIDELGSFDPGVIRIFVLGHVSCTLAPSVLLLCLLSRSLATDRRSACGRLGCEGIKRWSCLLGYGCWLGWRTHKAEIRRRLALSWIRLGVEVEALEQCGRWG